MAIGNRYELLDGQEYLGQDCLNVYYYRQIAGPAGNAGDLRQSWGAAVLPAVIAIQVDDVAHVAIATKNLDVPTDFEILPLVPGTTGTLVGDPMPPFVAWAFRLLRQQTNIRHGAKRYAGVSESSQSLGVATAEVMAALNNLADALGSDLLGDTGAIYEPRIMRRLLDAEGHLIGYEDFPFGLAQYVRISTQNTRKFGRGV